MLIPDVNVLIYAHRADTEAARRSGAWLSGALAGAEGVGWCDHVLGGFMRIVTNPRIFVEPTSLEDALGVCGDVLGGPAAQRIAPGPDHWEIFSDLCRSTAAAANDVPDAYLAALAIERNATFVTHDTGFGRFAGLRWSTPLV